ncbi:MAG TPA: DUF302 domain-containing protein [Vicinamibacterales bacterium]|nr:DUF302 domain-containing protein [Vicinamibacterales bacterium]HPW22212.1 DUF302 domain-containing protein [Vicinamibacterales bacterium]
MKASRYGISVEVPLPYEQALERTTDELKHEGFGVLTAIDVRQTIQQKLGKEFRKYTILGACNPPLAYRAFQAELEVGLLLPCNVVVYETDPGTSVVAAISPMSALAMASDNPALREVATEADAKLRRALTALESGGPAGKV